LFLARADNAKQAMAPREIEVEREFEKIVEAFEAVADDAGIRLAVEGRGRITADPELLRRALTNLVSNAIAHTPRDGRVTLRVHPSQQSVDLSVEASGTGISAQHLPKIFDRFYRVDAARSSFESTGLGLAVVKSIAQLHGATVQVHSTPGQGS